jgi:hypothetical protein
MAHAAVIEQSPQGYEVRRCRHCRDQPYQLWRNKRIEKFGRTRGELFRRVKAERSATHG